jgi:diguanylate cyclase (GGDEF)-like protein
VLKSSKRRVRRLVFVFIVLILFCGVFSLIQLSNLNDKAQSLSLHNLPKSRLASYLRMDLLQLQRLELRFVLSHDEDDRRALESQIKGIIVDIDHQLERYIGHSLSLEEQQYLGDFEKNWRQYSDLQGQLRKAVYQNMDDETLEKALDDRLVLYREMVHDASELMDFNSKAILTVSEDVYQTYRHSRQLIILSMIISLIVGTTVIVMFQRQLNRQENLQNQADRDVLTGLYNRRYFLTQAEKAFQSKERLAMIMADIDHFKSINDLYGHNSGDMALKFLARQMVQNLRINDIAARYGGEEFIILLPNTSLAGAKSIAERLREQIAQSVCHSENNRPFSFTLSLGVIENHGGLESLSQLINEVDKCLYFAKQNGRNRVATPLNVVADKL